MNHVTAGFALCGSFCTLRRAVEGMRALCALGCDVVPIMSDAVYSTDTRFGTAEGWIREVEALCRRPVIHEIRTAEPIGPKKLLDVLVIAPCTGNTLAKLANGITDTPVTMAAKAHLRNQRPLVIAPATNDALSGSAKNAGLLMNCKNVYFVPMGQDDPLGKPASLIADFSKIPEAVEAALGGTQLQPVFLG